MLKSISVTVLANAYVQAVSTLIFLLTARFYGVEGRGIYASATSMGTFSTTMLGLSVGMVLPFFVVDSGVPRREFFARTLTTVVALVLGLSLAALAAVFVAYAVDPKLLGKVPPLYLAAVGISFPYFMWVGSSGFIFSAAGEIVQENRITVVNRTAFLIVSSGLVVFGRVSLLTYLLLYGAFNITQMVREIWFLSRWCNAELVFDGALARRILRKGLTMHSVTIASLLNTSFSILTLNYYSQDLKDVGYFNFAGQLTAIIAMVPIVVSRYLISEITASDRLTVWPRQKRIMAYSCVFTAGVCGAAYFLIVPFCQFFKAEFLNAVPVFRFLLLAVLPSSYVILMQSQWYSSGQFKLMSAVNIGVGIAGAIITLIAVPHYHEMGAGATTLFTYLTLFGINVVFHFRLNRDARRAVVRGVPQASPSA